MARTVAKLNQVPFSVLISNSSLNLTMISIIDIRDPRLVKRLIKIENKCVREECSRRPCNMATSMTTTSANAAEEFSLMVTIPPQPWITVESSPSLTLIEFLTYIMSTMSTWTGLSIMSFLPSRLMKLKRRDLFYRRTGRDKKRTTGTHQGLASFHERSFTVPQVQ